MINWGDFELNKSIYLCFNSLGQSGSGASIVNGGIAVINNETSSIIAGTGIGLSGNVAGYVGLNTAIIDLNNSGFSDNKSYNVFFTSGTVDSVNITNNIIGMFSIGKLFNTAVETDYSLKNSLKLILSTLVGKVSGADTATVYIRDINNTRNRVIATCDASGNRTSITYDLSN